MRLHRVSLLVDVQRASVPLTGDRGPPLDRPTELPAVLETTHVDADGSHSQLAVLDVRVIAAPFQIKNEFRCAYPHRLAGERDHATGHRVTADRRWF